MEMKLLLWLQLLLFLAVLKHIQSMPTRQLTDEDWNALLELLGKSNKISSNNINEYYESFTVKPIIFKLDSNDNLNNNKLINRLTPPKLNKNIIEKEPEETDIWANVKSFFTNDLNNFAKNIADNYNPIPPIVSVVDDVKRSDTWTDVNSFFTKWIF